MVRSRFARSEALIALLLVLAALAVFAQVAGHGFLTYDDNEYVTGNEHVRRGLTLDGVRWALGSTAVYNWHPVTWLSHMLDVQLFGLRPAGHHLTSLLLHVGNTLLLFRFLSRTTGSPGRSGFAAALFAVHPLHVEAVAWIAERKEVLSALFLMLALLAYARWSADRAPWAYAAVVLSFALGLAAKPMLVTLPLLLLALDVWPLGRWRIPKRQLLVEKAPLVVLSAASALVTLWAQHQGGALSDLHAVPLGARLANAAVSYVRYVEQTVWPRKLAVFYPHPSTALPPWQVAVSASLLVAATAAAVATRRSRPWLLVGWVWYLVALLPVIGLVQVGEQARADRYTYLPLIGLFVVAAWGLTDLADRLRLPRRLLGTAAVAAVVALGAVACGQARLWRDTATLFRHALAVTDDNRQAHRVLGDALLLEERLAEAERHYLEALRIEPDDRLVRSNLDLYYRQGRAAEAVRQLEEAVRLDPRNAPARFNLGLAYGAWAAAQLAAGDRAGALETVRRGRERGYEPPPELLRALGPT